jgi:hypothetical protein
MIVIIVGASFATWGLVSVLSLGGVETAPPDHVSVNILNGGNLSNVTANYSARVYTANATAALDEQPNIFYRSWIVGTNGSAADVNLKIGSIIGGKNASAFIIVLSTNMTGYIKFNNFSLFVEANGIYNVEVWKDPASFIVTAYTVNGSGATIPFKTNDTDFFVSMDVSDGEDSAYAPSWHPEIRLAERLLFRINITFSVGSNLTNCRVVKTLSDPLMTINSESFVIDLSSTYTNLCLDFYIVRGFHLYEFMTNSVVANITAIYFSYGPTILQTITP